jgi:hypothetical protein
LIEFVCTITHHSKVFQVVQHTTINVNPAMPSTINYDKITIPRRLDFAEPARVQSILRQLDTDIGIIRLHEIPATFKALPDVARHQYKPGLDSGV